MKMAFALPALIAATSLATPLQATEEPSNPDGVDIVDAIECRLDVPSYNRFAFAISGEEKIAEKRHWTRVDTNNPFMNEYDLPAPITVAGHYSTRHIAFTSIGVLAILDLADPGEIAREAGIENAMDPDPVVDALAASGKATREEVEASVQFRKFLGEKIISDHSELPAEGEGFGARRVISLNVSNVTTHPGKTLYGCSYRMDLIDKDGQPL